jgi:hypothetical protein
MHWWKGWSSHIGRRLVRVAKLGKLCRYIQNHAACLPQVHQPVHPNQRMCAGTLLRAQRLSQTPNNLNLGFLTVIQNGNGYAGGYLVTNLWGRPLEFRLTGTVEPSRVHEVLYGVTLKPYLCADLIGKALIEKTTTPVQLLVTDHDLTLDIRHRVQTPVLLVLAGGQASMPADGVLRPPQENRPALVRHRRYPDDDAAIRNLVDKLDPTFDLLEPFSRIREAMIEVGNASAARAA